MEKVLVLCISILFFLQEGVCPIPLSSQEVCSRGEWAEEDFLTKETAVAVQELVSKGREAAMTAPPNRTEMVLHPAAAASKRWVVQSSRAMQRRQLAAFGVCSLCKCCDDAQTTCSYIGCCYSIVCNAPNQPFGLCSLAPSACDCLSCPT